MRVRGIGISQFAVAATILIGVAGCVSEGDAFTSARIVNDLPDAVIVFQLRDGSEDEVGRLSAGEAMLIDLGERDLFDSERGRYCTIDDLVARTNDGVEVARIPPQLCQGDHVLLSSYPPD